VGSADSGVPLGRTYLKTTPISPLVAMSSICAAQREPTAWMVVLRSACVTKTCLYRLRLAPTLPGVARAARPSASEACAQWTLGRWGGSGVGVHSGPDAPGALSVAAGALNGRFSFGWAAQKDGGASAR